MSDEPLDHTTEAEAAQAFRLIRSAVGADFNDVDMVVSVVLAALVRDDDAHRLLVMAANTNRPPPPGSAFPNSEG